MALELRRKWPHRGRPLEPRAASGPPEVTAVPEFLSVWETPVQATRTVRPSCAVQAGRTWEEEEHTAAPWSPAKLGAVGLGAEEVTALQRPWWRLRSQTILQALWVAVAAATRHFLGSPSRPCAGPRPWWG